MNGTNTVPPNNTQDTFEDDPMGTHIVHKLLVISESVQQWPRLVVLAVLLAFSGLIYLAWGLRTTPQTALIAAALSFAFSLSDWLALWLLPRLGRSFGPDQPSAVALAGLRALLVIPLGLLGAHWLAALILHAGISMLAAYATWVEPFWLGVTHQRYAFDGWSSEAPPLRLLHVGDIHVERLGPRERRLNALISELQPDVIVFSGDFVNVSYTSDHQSYQDIRRVISQWDAPLGVYCVPGTYTVEPLETVRRFVGGLSNLRLLEDEWVHLDAPGGRLNLLGMVTTHRYDVDGDKVRTLANGRDDGLNLLLTHAPDAALHADDAGYHLYLCGHTHGGQIRLPLVGPVFTGSALGRRFAMGRKDMDSVTVYTTRGVGLEGMGAPRARLMCPPEIVLWEIHGVQ